jgi:precorrin-2 dehydrogenase / sirohydrochlorin ferrochelatase
MSSSAPALFPMFVKLQGRNCLVVGGGAIAESKVQSLLAAGGTVRLVAPQVTLALAEYARLQRIAWTARAFETADLDGVFLVIAATSDDKVNELIFREADRSNILCNAVDQPPRCHFYFPAVVRRGALQIAISTAGLSPALAQRIRKELEAEFGPEYEEWLERLGRVRAWLMRKGTNFERRKRLLHRLASREAFSSAQTRRSSKRPEEGAVA